ncbi:hypothetical protein [Phenylobacterium immobile]|uniref:hypothetical protein n=1 Tax=Phenylobacterium immobile TaxID=21 RepID=UPI000AA86125|nr:hypothetical protein [Phenylobacterium immobile]
MAVWKQNPDLMQRLIAAQNALTTPIDIVTFAGMCGSREELLAHVLRYETPKPLPLDRLFWIVTPDLDVVEVAHHDDASFWYGRTTFARQDGEPGSWEPDEIEAWADTRAEAEAIAAQLMQEAA